MHGSESALSRALSSAPGAPARSFASVVASSATRLACSSVRRGAEGVSSSPVHSTTLSAMTAAAASSGSLDGLLAYGVHFICVWALGLVLGWLVRRCRRRFARCPSSRPFSASRHRTLLPRAAPKAKVGSARPHSQAAAAQQPARPVGPAGSAGCPRSGHSQVRAPAPSAPPAAPSFAAG